MEKYANGIICNKKDGSVQITNVAIVNTKLHDDCSLVQVDILVSTDSNVNIPAFSYTLKSNATPLNMPDTEPMSCLYKELYKPSEDICEIVEVLDEQKRDEYLSDGWVLFGELEGKRVVKYSLGKIR